MGRSFQAASGRRFCWKISLLLLGASLLIFIAHSGGDDSGNAGVYQYRPSHYVRSFEGFRDAMGAPTECNGECDGDKRRETLQRQGSKGKVVVAAVQLETAPNSVESLDDDSEGAVMQFWNNAVRHVKEAVEVHKASLVLLPELFMGPYFCQSQEAALFGLADAITEHPFLPKLQQLARTYSVVLPISIFERYNNAYYNSVVMINSDGAILGTYRKSHIPDGTGYQEKFYFTPGDTGFQVFDTSVGKVGVAICWDQWFPEAARSMALMGADLLLYPTAIGSEPQDASLDSSDHWQRVMQGHAAANMVPVLASNRYGTEVLLHEDEGMGEKQRITFYGRSFITDETGAIVAEAKEGGSAILTWEVDIQQNRADRASWGLFRDRRPDLYGILRTKDGQRPLPVS